MHARRSQKKLSSYSLVYCPEKSGSSYSLQYTRRMFNIDGEREQANWDMAAILEQQSVPLVSFRKKTGRASYCKKREHVKLR